MSSECVFCEISAAREYASIVYRDGGLLAFMSNAPVNPGHLLIIPEVHTPSLSELKPGLAAHILLAAQQLGAALRKSTLRCGAIDLFLADGEAASQLVPHLHLHVIPRLPGDSFKLNPRGGVTTWETMPSRAELDRTAEAVRIASTI
jgi:diadenosine tetraphosphate (Ap4A) HIT family hydrolase